MRVELPKTSAKKLEFYELQFAQALGEAANLPEVPPIAYNPQENWIEVEGVDEETVKATYKSFKPEDRHAWKKKMRTLLEKEDLSEEESTELNRLQRRFMIEQLGG